MTSTDARAEPIIAKPGFFRSPPFSLLARDKWLQSLTGVIVVAFCVSTVVVPRPHGVSIFWDNWVYNIAFAVPIIPMLLCARRSPELRAPWRFMAAAVALNSIGTLVYTYHDQNLHPIPSPALSDVFYLACYGAFIVGVVLLTQMKVGRTHVSIRLDGVIAGLAMASLAGLLWFGPVLKVSGRPLQVVVGMAYPLFDLVLMVLLIAGLAPNRYRPNWSVVFLMAGLICWIVGDVVYLNQQAANTYVGGTFLDSSWIFGVWLMGLAASANDRRHSRSRGSSDSSYGISLMPVAAGLLSIGVIAACVGIRTNAPVVLSLALAALCLVIARMWLTLGEERELMTASDLDARTDALTGLPNRRSFFEHFDSQYGTLEGGRAGVILIDLDGFKVVNDTLGHLVGDDLLRVVSKRFGSRLAGRGFLARLGGDEFAVAAGVMSEAELVAIAAELTASLTNPCVLDGVTVHVGASAGVAISAVDRASSTELLRSADVAMYEAKRAHLDYAVYRAVNDPNSREHLELVGALKEAIEANELTLHYQPLFDIQTLEVRGVEALARWQHPELGLVEPDIFIPMAEGAGLMPQLTRVVLEQAVDEAIRLDRCGHHLYMTVNISRYDLVDHDLPSFIEALLASRDFPAERLTLEITESTLGSDPFHTAKCVNDLRTKGVRMAIDDYGVGYSSMSQLLELEIDELKVDTSFIIGLASDLRAQAIVRSAIELAHALSLSLVAEGIEEVAVLRLLQEFGADVGQGFFVAQPLSPDQLDVFLARAPMELGTESPIAVTG